MDKLRVAISSPKGVTKWTKLRTTKRSSVEIVLCEHQMNWQIGQKVVCDRPEQLLTGCTVTTQDQGWVTISCPTAGFALAGYQDRFEQEGWTVEQERDRVAACFKHGQE